MITGIETVSEKIDLEQLCGERDRTYVMKGSYAEKALETYHMILAPSFRCNIGCKHCYLSDHDVLTLPKERVLDLVNKWSEIVIEDRGPFGGIFHIKGGEPLILPYLNDILDRLEDLKTLRFMMTTNGIAGDQNIIERLHSLSTALDGNVQIIVSIDGSNDAVNAQLRGPGNFGKAVDFVRMLRNADITVYLNNVLHKGNLCDVESFVQLAMDLDVQQVNFLSFNPKGYGKQMASLAPKPDQVFKCIDTVWETGDQRVRSLLAGSLSDILHAESCGSCTSSECVGGYRGLLYIVPSGATYSCPNLDRHDMVAGNILDSELKSIHNARQSEVYRKIHVECRETRYSCMGVNLSSGANNDFVSAISHLRCNHKLSDVNPKELLSYCFNRNW